MSSGLLDKLKGGMHKRKIVRVERTPLGPPPMLVDGTLYIAEYPRSAVITHGDLVACNITFPAHNWWFFVERKGRVKEVQWATLTDDQQMGVRAALLGSDVIFYSIGDFPYNNECCYAVETLEHF